MVNSYEKNRYVRQESVGVECMMKRIHLIFTVLLLCYSHSLWGADDYEVYQLNTPEQQTQFDRLTHELRCLVCQNETLAESNAPLAKDLRQEIVQQVLAGEEDQQILDYLVARYGDFILYRPRITPMTYLLWFTPLLLLLVGLMVWWWVTSQKRVQQ